VAKGIKSFKKGMSEDEPTTPAADPFKKEEPKALDSTAQSAQAQPTAQVNKAG
jgi:Sec-independent protein translocase protein TatA